jgi:hypothetical protein
VRSGTCLSSRWLLFLRTSNQQGLDFEVMKTKWYHIPEPKRPMIWGIIVVQQRVPWFPEMRVFTEKIVCVVSVYSCVGFMHFWNERVVNCLTCDLVSIHFPYHLISLWECLAQLYTKLNLTFLFLLLIYFLSAFCILYFLSVSISFVPTPQLKCPASPIGLAWALPV